MKRKRSRRPRVSTPKDSISERSRVLTQLSIAERFDDLPFNEPHVLGILLMDGEYRFDEVLLHIAPAWRFKSLRGRGDDDKKSWTDYYFIDKKHFDAADLRALRRFEV